MRGLRRLYRGQIDIDFPKLWKPVLTVSVVLVLISIGSLIFRGLHLAIDFEGGAVWEVPSKSLTVAQATDVLAKFGKADGAKVQVVKDAKGDRIVRIQADSKNITESQKIAQAYADKVGKRFDDIGTNTVGPSWGKEITGQAIRSLVVFIVLITLYISWQLEWRMAAAAIAGVVHDVVLTVGVYSVFGFEVTPATVISFLTILGYSLYDTIVVYDRLKENSARYDRGGQYTYRAMMRRSLNQVMMRSVNTTLVSLLPVVSMLLIGAVAYGQVALQDFSLALLIGLASGAYSSIFVASPVLAWLKEREPKYVRIRQRATERGDLARAEWIPIDPAAAAAPMASSAASAGNSTATATLTATRAGQYQRTHPPRPRKQGKRR